MRKSSNTSACRLPKSCSTKIWKFRRSPESAAPGRESSMSNRLNVLAGLLAALIVPLAAQAHHSFAAEFDASKPIVIDGTVVKFAWVNPHSWLYIDVPKPDGTVEHWKVEGGAPSALLRKGWNRN